MLKRLAATRVRTILVGLLILGLLMSVLSAIIQLTIEEDCRLAQWFGAWTQNFSTELVGAAITFFIFDLWIGNREKVREQSLRRREFQEQSRTKLISAQSPEQKQAIIDEMNKLDALQGADLRSLDLRGVHLANMNLDYSDLTGADLSGADISGSTMREAILMHANLSGADLSSVSLRGADVRYAKLTMAIFRGTDFSGATVDPNALASAILDPNTTLPTGIGPHNP